MLRSILASVVGITFAVIVITALEGFGKVLFPVPEQDVGQPLAALLWAPLTYTMGTTLGVFIAGYYGKPDRLPAFLVVLFLAAAIFWNVSGTLQPFWLSALSLAAIGFGALTGFGLAQSLIARKALRD